MKKRTVIRNILNIRAFTHRRTPKDVDGRRWDVPCVVLCRDKTYLRWVHVRFDDGHVDMRHIQSVTAGLPTSDGRSGKATPVFIALKDLGSGMWWINANNVLERAATRYEVERVTIDPVPSDGWKLVDGATHLTDQKQLHQITHLPRSESEVERRDREHKAFALQARRDKRCAHAAAMVALHTSKMKREEKLVAKWTREHARAMKVRKS